MYSEKVMDHFQHPRNVGEIENASGVGTVGNAKCGDIMRIFLDIDDETHIIKDCKFKTFGCGAAVATSSMATEMVMGKTIEEGHEGNEQGCYGSPRRASACKGPLFPSGRGSDPCGAVGLCGETSYRDRRPVKTQV